MKKNVYLLIGLGLLGSLSPTAKAQHLQTRLQVQDSGTEVDSTTTVTWPFNLGTADQVATFSGGTADFYSTNYVSIGSSLAYKDVNTTYSVTYTRFQPSTQLGAASADGLIAFHIRPKTGLNFTPGKVSFDCMRFGTDGGKMDVLWRCSDGTADTLAKNISPARNNSGAGTHAVYDLSTVTIPASEGDCSLEVYLYGLGITKQFGIANIVLEGKTKGTLIPVVTHTISTAVLPASAGTATTKPVGSAFDEGTSMTLTAKRNFGYNFAYWAKATGDSVSGDNPLTFTLTQDTALTAVFRAINTYSLTMTASGGASNYMVSASPSGTTVDGKLLYEEGTTVTVSASNNAILTFTNWATGETNADLVVPMTKNQEVTAVYSAVDFIVGWDFYKTGNAGRVADFYSTTENESASLILRDSTGVVATWLDKSQLAAGGYEGKAAAVNWNALTSCYYYQASFNAKDFTNIKVASSMMCNYNGYSVQRCEYSLNGTDFKSLGFLTLTAAKAWVDSTFSLPSDADHAEKVYIRWIPDYTSSLIGTTATNDGTAIAAIYVTATAAIFNDGVAPVLQSSVPAEGATGASATGKVVLTFDEKVTLTDAAATTATLGNEVLTPVVSGKTIMFPYTSLDYNTFYTFRLAGNKVADIAGNFQTDSIVLHFTTMVRPTVTKKMFDFVVGVDGDFKAALTAAQAASSTGKRFYIFFPTGQYNIGGLTGDANQMTSISIPNVSYVGQDADSVVVYNKSTLESINSTATMYMTSASDNVYMQDISLMNKMDYRTGTLVGRGVALWDQGSKNIYKNVKLLSNQDTYYTGGDRSYLENCEIHGTVDFICGGGDLFFNECLIYLEERSGNCITAPASAGNWGYVFSHCTIDGYSINNGTYRLGRPWSNTPKSVYINTTMNILPTPAGWGDPMNVVPSVFAEYNSMTASGAAVDLTSRRSSYTKDATTVTLNPVLTAEQAAQYTIQNVLGSTDAWQPNLYTEQAFAPVISIDGTSLKWDDSDYVLCWAVCKNGVFVQFVTTNSYVIPDATAAGAIFTVRAANEMGGLSKASNAYVYNASALPQTVNTVSAVVEKMYYSLDGRRHSGPVNGLNIVRTRYEDGRMMVSKEVCILNK
jgi:pectin methylesterase-like acyl-CoA thioesterase